jgi:RNA polymerase sigma-70 factor (ECF subfamily)
MYLRDPVVRRSWPPVAAEVSAAQRGDVRVLTAFAAAAIPKLIAFYRGLGLGLQDAEDLASETCEAVLRSLPRLRDPGRFEAWFWRIARSKFYDHLRHRRRRPISPERDLVDDDPADPLLLADEHAAIREAFTTLKARDRELLWLRDVIGLAYSEIAGRFGVTEGAIRIGVMRARQRLEAALLEVEGPQSG